jgi:hypothetical protein
MAKMNTESALAEGFFWMGEKCRYGYEGVEQSRTCQRRLPYNKAAEWGEITAFAAMARLVSRTKQAPKAAILWMKYFAELAKACDVDLGTDEPASSIHSYFFSKLARFEMPLVYGILP